MTFAEIIDLIAFYGVDVAALAVITCLLTQILKTTWLKNAPNKIYTVLPFIIGLAVYALYVTASRVSFCYVFLNFKEVLEQGFKTGGAATVFYVVYEQFVRGKTAALTENALSALLAGYVADGKQNAAAAEIVNSPESADEILNRYKRADACDAETAALVKLVKKLLEP